jgi:hypothetical protein
MTCNNRQPHHSAMPQNVTGLLPGIDHENTAAINQESKHEQKKLFSYQDYLIRSSKRRNSQVNSFSF